MPADIFWIMFGPIIGIVVIWLIIFGIRKAKENAEKAEQLARENEVREAIRGLAANEIEMTPEDFFKMRNVKGTKTGTGTKGKYALNFNFEGVYIIYNETKNMYYVGQAQQVLNRVNMHFTGRGNGDIYADFKYGDKFKIKMISLKNSGYKDLNKLERDTIKTYNAFAQGYNKTSGNKMPDRFWGKSNRNIKQIVEDIEDEYGSDDENEESDFNRMQIKSMQWQLNKSKSKDKHKEAIQKIKKYISSNKDWCLPNKNQRINYFYLNEKFYYERAATWPEFIDQNINFVMSPLPKSTIESIIEPVYKKICKNKY